LASNTFTFDNEDVVYIWENYLENNIVEMNLTFFVKEGNVYRRFDEEHTERAYRDEDLEKLILKSGFKIIQKLDNYETILTGGECERIAYVLAKN
jgi:hypothetical protein